MSATNPPNPSIYNFLEFRHELPVPRYVCNDADLGSALRELRRWAGFDKVAEMEKFEDTLDWEKECPDYRRRSPSTFDEMERGNRLSANNIRTFVMICIRKGTGIADPSRVNGAANDWIFARQAYSSPASPKDELVKAIIDGLRNRDLTLSAAEKVDSPPTLPPRERWKPISAIPTWPRRWTVSRF